MIMVEHYKFHFTIAFGALKRIISKRQKNQVTPQIEVQKEAVSGFWNEPVKTFVFFAMSCIEAVVSGHFKVLLRDVLDEKLNEVQYGEGFDDIRVIFVLIIMKSDIFSIIRINARGGNDRPSKIPADIFCNGIRVTERGLGINIESILISAVNVSFYLFKGSPEAVFEEIEKSRLERLTQKRIVKMCYRTPQAIVRKAAFGKETVDMGIPFKGTSKSVKDTDKAWDKVFGLIDLMEHTQDDITDSVKKTAQERAVLKEKVPEFFVNGKNKMAMGTADELKRNLRCAFNRVFIPAGGTKLGMAAERNKFKFTTMRAFVHGTSIGRIPTIDHFFNSLHNDWTWIENIINFFKMLFKNSL